MIHFGTELDSNFCPRLPLGFSIPVICWRSRFLLFLIRYPTLPYLFLFLEQQIVPWIETDNFLLALPFTSYPVCLCYYSDVQHASSLAEPFTTWHGETIARGVSIHLHRQVL